MGALFPVMLFYVSVGNLPKEAPELIPSAVWLCIELILMLWVGSHFPSRLAVASMFLMPLPFEVIAGSLSFSCGQRQAQDGTTASKIVSGAIGGAALLVAGLQPRNIADADGELLTLFTRIFELGILMVALGGQDGQGHAWRRARGDLKEIDLPTREIEDSQVLKVLKLDGAKRPGVGCRVRLRNGLEMPQLGLGSGGLEGKEGREAICTALRAGYRLIDTALFYRIGLVHRGMNVV
eukprot:g23678.t1